MPRIQVQDADLYMVEEGAGDPVVLVHGTLADYRTWLLQVREISRSHHVIAYSRRYHAPNPAGPVGGTYSVSVQAEDLIQVIRARFGTSAHVVTSSYGGCVGLEAALKGPEMVRSLVLSEPPLMPWLLRSEQGRSLFPTVLSAQAASNRAFKAGNPRDGVRAFCDMAMGPGVFDALPARAQARLMDNASELALEMATPTDALFPQVSCEALLEMRVPVLLLTGETSLTLYRVITDQLERCLPSPQRSVIGGAGHILHNANPLAFSERVLRFMEGT